MTSSSNSSALSRRTSSRFVVLFHKPQGVPLLAEGK
ncbi:MAG: hypothetical protein QOD62_1080 [Actinomycetota bacterium]|nr:hypothetical protein [Actinomycetota bacterium]